MPPYALAVQTHWLRASFIIHSSSNHAAQACIFPDVYIWMSHAYVPEQIIYNYRYKLYIYIAYTHKSCIHVYIYIWWPQERGGSLPQRRVVGAIPSVAYRSTCHWNHEHSFMRKNVNQPLFVIPLKRILASCGQRTGSARVNQPFDFKRSRSTSLRKLGLIIISCMHIRLFTTVCIRMTLHFSTQHVHSVWHQTPPIAMQIEWA